MRRKLTIVITALGLLVVVLPLPGQAIIHELVASHCNGGEVPNNDANIDPPGQLNDKGNSFARALQASGIYDVQFGVDQTGTVGIIDFTTDPPTFGPMPAPVADTVPVTIVVDNTSPNAKLGDDFVWAFFVDVEAGLSVYIQLYDLDHPAFEHCENIHP